MSRLLRSQGQIVAAIGQKQSDESLRSLDQSASDGPKLLATADLDQASALASGNSGQSASLLQRNQSIRGQVMTELTSYTDYHLDTIMLPVDKAVLTNHPENRFPNHAWVEDLAKSWSEGNALPLVHQTMLAVVPEDLFKAALDRDGESLKKDPNGWKRACSMLGFSFEVFDGGHRLAACMHAATLNINIPSWQVAVYSDKAFIRDGIFNVRYFENLTNSLNRNLPSTGITFSRTMLAYLHNLEQPNASNAIYEQMACSAVSNCAVGSSNAKLRPRERQQQFLSDQYQLQMRSSEQARELIRLLTGHPWRSHVFDTQAPRFLEYAFEQGWSSERCCNFNLTDVDQDT